MKTKIKFRQEPIHKRIIAWVMILSLSWSQTGLAQMIVVDGRTDTTINTSDNVNFDVHTKTISGNVGFNSFTKFDVDTGTNVNLHLAGGTSSLVNMVTGSTSTTIDGQLNSYKGGQIGGNVFFLNPNGIIVGANGVINVGALTLATPTKAFIDQVYNGGFNSANPAVAAILAGDMPINSTGLISIKGKINTLRGADIQSNNVSIAKGAQVNANFDPADIVNIGNYASDGVKIENGKITIIAKNDDTLKTNTDVAISGDIVTNGEGIAISAENNVSLEGVTFEAQNSTVSAKANGNLLVRGENVILNTDTPIAKDTAKSNLLVNAKNINLDGKNITIESGKYSTSSGKWERSGNVDILGAKIKSENGSKVMADGISVKNTLNTDGSNIDFTTGGKFTLDKGASINTTNSTKDKAGAVSVVAKNILVSENSSIIAQAKDNNGHVVAVGDISLMASNSDFNWMSSSLFSSIEIKDNATLWGKNIGIKSFVQNTGVLDTESPDFDEAAFNSSIGKIDMKTVDGNFFKDFIYDFNLGGAYIVIDMSSSVDIGKNVDIKATDSINISSTNKIDSSMQIMGLVGAVLISKLDVDSKVKIGEGTTIESYDTNIESILDLNVKYSVSSFTNPGPNLPVQGAVLFSFINSNNTIDIAKNSSISSLQGLNIIGKTKSNIVTGVSASASADAFSAAAANITVNDIENNVNLNGSLTSQQGNINALSDIDTKFAIRSNSCVGDNGSMANLKSFAGTSLDGVFDWLSGKLLATSSVGVAFSGAVSYGDYENTANLTLGSNFKSISANDSTFSSTITESFLRSAAISSIYSNSTHSKQNSASLGVSMLWGKNTALVKAEDGASFDAQGNLSFNSKHYLPYTQQWTDTFTSPNVADGALFLLFTGLDDDANYKDFFTSAVQSNAQTTDDGLGIAGTVNLIFSDTTSNVDLGAVRINQNSNSQNSSLNINASADSAHLNVSGLSGFHISEFFTQDFFGNKAKNAVGASYQQMDYKSAVKATIGDNAQINVNKDFSITALNNINEINLSASGASAGSFGLQGVFNWTNVNNTTIASIGDSRVTIGDSSSGKSPKISASDTGNYLNFAGSLLKSSASAVGAAVATTNVARTTKAFVGLNNNDFSYFKSDKGLDISAYNKGSIYSYAMSATISVEDKALNPPKPPMKPIPSITSYGDAEFGIGISGSVSLIFVEDDVLSYLNTDYIGKELLSINAENSTLINTVSGAAAVAFRAGSSAGLAGAFSFNDVANSTSAYIASGATVANEGDVKVEAKSDNDILGIAASASGTVSLQNKSASVAGSVILNNISNTTKAYAENALVSGENISFNAVDTSEILGVAGSVSVSAGMSGAAAGIGASIAINTINNDVFAYAKNSKLSSQSNIGVLGKNESIIKGISSSAGIVASGGKNLAAAIVVSANDIENDTNAYISGGESKSENGDVNVSAINQSEMLSVAGQASASVGNGVALGAASGVSIIKNKTDAYIDGAKISTVKKGGANVYAEGNSDITTGSAGVSVSTGTAGAAGSLAINQIFNVVESRIYNSTLNVIDNVSVNSLLNDEVNFYGGTLGGGAKVGVGATFVINQMTSQSIARVFNSSVSAKNLSVKSDSTMDLEAWSFTSGIGSVTGVAGNVTISSLNNISKAEISGNSIVNTGENVDVLAKNTTKEMVNGGSIGAAATAGVGAVSEWSDINNTTYATIENAKVTSDGDVNVNTDNFQSYDAILMSGGIGGTAGIAGNVAIVDIGGENKASINSSTVKSKKDLTVNAKDNVEIGKRTELIIGALAAGGKAGVAGGVLLTDVTNSNLALISSSAIDASKNLKVNADSTYYTKSIVPSLGAGMAGLALSFGGNTINTKSEAYIEGDSTIINGDAAYLASEQSVFVKANSSATIEDYIVGVGAGAVGIGAAVNLTTLDNKASAGVLSGVTLNAQKDLNISAETNNKIVDNTISFAGGALAVNGSISVSNIGSAIDSDSLVALGGDSNTNTLSSINNEGQRNKAINSDMLGFNGAFADSANFASSMNKDASALFDKNTKRDGSTSAFIGANAKVKVGNNININAVNNTTLNSIVGGASIGLTEAFGASVAISNIASSTKAFIADGASVEANGTGANNSISINAKDNLNSDLTAFIGSGSMGLSLGAVVAKINANNYNYAYVGKNAYIDSLGGIIIDANSFADMNSIAVGASVGGQVGVGAAVAYISKGGETSSYVGDNSTIESDENISVKASNDSSLSTDTTAASGGIVAGSGAVTSTKIADVLSSYIGENSTIKAGKAFELSTLGKSEIDNINRGIAGGGIAVGASISNADIVLDNKAKVSKGVKIIAKDIDINTKQNAASDITAFAAGGGLIGGMGADATANISGGVSTYLGDFSNLKATDTLKLFANSNLDIYTGSKRYQGALISGGANYATTNTTLNTTVKIGNSSSISGKSVDITALSANKANTETLSGSGGVVDAAAAKAKTENNSDTSVVIGDNAVFVQYLDITGEKLNIQANSTVTHDASVDATQGGAITGGSIDSLYVNNQKTAVDLSGYLRLFSNNAHIKAEGNLNKNHFNENLNYEAYGAIACAFGDATSNVNMETFVDLGSHSKIFTFKDAETSGNFVVDAFNNIKFVDYARFSGGAFAGFPNIESSTTLLSSAKVKMDYANLDIAGDLIMNTRTNADVSSKSNVSFYGAAAMAEGRAYGKVSVDDAILLKLDADVKGDVYLNTGTPHQGENAKLKVDVESKIWNSTAVPLYTEAKASGVTWYSNYVELSKGYNLSSAKNINITTAKADSTINYKAASYSWPEDKVVTVDKTSGKFFYDLNYVDIEGTLSSGANAYLDIKITKNPVTGEIEVSNPDIKYDITDENLANNLASEIAKLEELKQTYSTDAELVKAYDAEIASIKNKMNVLGLLLKVPYTEMSEILDSQIAGIDNLIATTTDPDLLAAYNKEKQSLEANKYAIDSDPDKDTKFFEMVKEVQDAKFVTLKDITIGSGDVKIKTDFLVGSGEIRTGGVSSVNITNEAPVHLRIGDITMENSVMGNLYMNGQIVENSAAIDKLNKYNPKALPDPKFNSVNIDVTHAYSSDLVSGVNIKNIYTGNASYPTTNLEIEGDIYNPFGNINLYSEGSIMLNGSLYANTVTITSKADLMQSYINGFFHVGGSPSDIWKDIAIPAEQGKTNTTSQDTPTKPSKSSILADNIFINARYVDLNGLVQAGVDSWSFACTNSDEIKLANGQYANWALNDYNTRLANGDINASPLYLILAENGNNLPAYYNAQTNSIEIGSVYSNGGRIEIFGHILNTGVNTGELRVLDGYSKVFVAIEGGREKVKLTVNDIMLNEVHGQIKITDTARLNSDGSYYTSLYMHEDGKLNVYDNLNGYDANGNLKLTNSLSGTRETIYKPFENQRYQWNTGKTFNVSRETIDTWKSLSGSGSTSIKTSTVTLPNVALIEGESVFISSDKTPYTYKYEQHVFVNELIAQKNWTSGDTFYTSSVYDSGTKDYNTHTINASNPVKISFIGHESGEVNISATNYGFGATKPDTDILLKGSIYNPSGNVNISSISRGVGNIGNIGAASITGKIINLEATTNIGKGLAIDVNVVKGGYLNAITEDYLNLASKNNSLIVHQINSGNLSLTSANDLLKYSDSSYIVADKSLFFDAKGNVDLRFQTVNTELNPVNIHATGNVSLVYADGFTDQKLYINEIIAGGDVYISGGNLYSTNPDATVDDKSIEARMQEWTSMGLFKSGYVTDKDGNFVLDESGNKIYQKAWSADQLMYAISSEAFNGGVSEDMSNTLPNISGKTVTLDNLRSAGQKGASKYIDLTDTSKLTIDDLKLLNGASALNIAFHKDNGVLIGATVWDSNEVWVNSNTLNIRGVPTGWSSWDFYICSQKDINLGAFSSCRDLSLRSAGGIYSQNGDVFNMNNGRIYLESGTGSIGTAANPLSFNFLTHNTFSAKSKSDIYLNIAGGTCYVEDIKAQGLLDIKGLGNISTERVASGYPNSKALTMTANGINIDVAGDVRAGIALEQTKLQKEGQVNEANIKGKNIVVSSTDKTKPLYIGKFEALGDITLTDLDGIILNADKDSFVKAGGAFFSDMSRTSTLGAADSKIKVFANDIGENIDGNNLFMSLTTTVDSIDARIGAYGDIDLDFNSKVNLQTFGEVNSFKLSAAGLKFLFSDIHLLSKGDIILDIAGDFEHMKNDIKSQNGDVAIDVKGDITIPSYAPSEFAAAGDVSVKANNINASHLTLTAGGDVSVKVEDTISTNSTGVFTVNAGKDVSLQAGENIDFSKFVGNIPGDLSIIVGSDNPLENSYENYVHIGDELNVGGDLYIKAPMITMFSADVYGNIDLIATGYYWNSILDGTIRFGGDLISQNGSINFTGTNISLNTLSTTKDLNVSVENSFYVALDTYVGGNLNLYGESQVSLAALGSLGNSTKILGDAKISSKSSIDIGGALDVGGDLDILITDDNSGYINANADISAGKDLSISGGTLALANLDAKGDIKVSSQQDATLGNVSGENIEISSLGGLSLNGNLNATDSISLMGLDLVVDKTLSANNDILINAKSFESTLNSSIESSLGNLTINANDSVLLGTLLKAGNDIIVDVKNGNFTSEETLNAINGSVNISGKDILINEGIWAAKDILLNGENIIADSLTTGAGDARVSSQKGDISIDTIAAAGDVLVDGNGNTTVGSLSGKKMTLSAFDNLTLNGNISASDKLNTLSKILAINGDVSVGNSININSGDLIAASKLESRSGNIDVVSTGDIMISGVMEALLGDVSLRATGTINDTYNDEVSHSIITNNLNLTAHLIGAPNDNLCVKVSGKITPKASGGIYIRGYSNSLSPEVLWEINRLIQSGASTKVETKDEIKSIIEALNASKDGVTIIDSKDLPEKENKKDKFSWVK